MPFHSPLFYFWKKVIKPTLVTCHVVLNKLNIFKQHTIPAIVRKHFYNEVCTPPSPSEELRGYELSNIPNFPPSPRWQNAPPPLHSNSCCHFPDCHVSVLSDRLIQFSYISLSRGSSQVTTRGVISKVCVSYFKMLSPIQCLDMHNVDLLLNRKFYHCMWPKQHPHQPVSHTEI